MGVIPISLFLLATKEYGFRPVGMAVDIGGHDLNAFGGVIA